jgi:aromatic-L-amino-acid decarboxylase
MTGYLAEVEHLPVLAQVHPGELRAGLPALPPEEAEAMEAILRDFREAILPAVTHWNHPSFHGYFAVTGSGPGIVGEMLSATLNVNAMVWRSSPAGTELEAHVLDWFRGMLGLPEGFAGVIQDTASTSSLVALAAARHRAWPEARVQGLFGLPPGRVYVSEEAHSSIEKAVLTLGLGQEAVRKIPTDGAFRMDVEGLRREVTRDREAGVRPVAVVATVGTTSTTSVDPVPAIGAVAREAGAWLHVDAAYAGSAAIVPELQVLFSGWEGADSIVVNPHKWLFTPVDCSVLFMRDPAAVRSAFSLVPEYLQTPESAETTNLMDYGVALGRRFRALKLWYVIRAFGVEGLRERIREHLRLAREVVGWIERDTGWELVAPLPFSTVVFRRRWPALAPEEEDRRNLALMEAVNASGEAFLSHTRLRERVALRLSVGNLRTELRHLKRTWARLEAEAAALDH